MNMGYSDSIWCNTSTYQVTLREVSFSNPICKEEIKFLCSCMFLDTLIRLHIDQTDVGMLESML